MNRRAHVHILMTCGIAASIGCGQGTSSPNRVAPTDPQAKNSTTSAATVDARVAPLKPEFTAAASVLLLRDLCEHSKRGDHAWVEARVQLPLKGMQSMNANDPDQMLAAHENSSVEEFYYTRYCLMLSDTDSNLRDFTLDEGNASGLIYLGPSHIEFTSTSRQPLRASQPWTLSSNRALFQHNRQRAAPT